MHVYVNIESKQVETSRQISKNRQKSKSFDSRHGFEPRRRLDFALVVAILFFVVDAHVVIDAASRIRCRMVVSNRLVVFRIDQIARNDRPMACEHRTVVTQHFLVPHNEALTRDHIPLCLRQICPIDMPLHAFPYVDDELG